MIKKYINYCLGLVLLLAWQSTVWAQYESPTQAYYQHQVHVNSLKFTEQSSVKLEGEWQFFQRQFVAQTSQGHEPRLVHFPESFQNITGSNQNYGSFVGHFKIPKAFVGRRIAILVPSQPSAYRLYLNGDLLLRLGVIATDPKAQITEKASRIAYFVPEKEYFSLSLQVSSSNHLHGGFEKPIKIGLARVINRQFQLQMMSIAMVSGAILGVGLSILLFALFRGSEERNSKRVFVFGLFIIFLALHNLFSAPHAYTVFTNIEWLWGTRLEYLFSFAALLFFLTYMHWLNPRYLNQKIYAIAVAALLLNIVLSWCVEQEVFERFALYSSLCVILVLFNFGYGFYQTVKRGENYSLINLCAVIFLCLTLSHDILLMMNLIDSVNLSFISTSLYVLLIMFQQSRNYAHHTYHTEQLNLQLVELNNSLDLKVKQRTAELHQLNEKLVWQNKIDALTGAFNRRALNEEIKNSFEQTQQKAQSSLLFAMLDVDFFKYYNDYYGHLKGDDILQSLVQCMQQTLPEQAFVARYGGEEFAIVLAQLSKQQAIDTLQDLLQQIHQVALPHASRPDGLSYITLSIGAAYMDDTHQYADVHALMRAADTQLYAAKAAGRNQLKI